MVVPLVSKYTSFEFVPSDIIYMHKLAVITSDKYALFSCLSSTIHSIWSWKNSSTLGAGTLNYSSTDCFETFPIPRNEYGKDQKLEILGKSYNEHRKHIMLSIQLGLTKTYNLFHSQYLTSADIEKQSKQPREVSEQALLDILKLRELHVQMDQAVLEAYGWQDIQLRHDFYEVDYLPENDRVRYTIHPEARKEILKRLLELNHKIHEEEVKAGLWDKKKYKIKKKKSGVEEPKEQYGLGI